MLQLFGWNISNIIIDQDDVWIMKPWPIRIVMLTSITFLPILLMGCERRITQQSVEQNFFSAAATGNLAALRRGLHRNPAIINATDNGLSVADGGKTPLEYTVSGMDGSANLSALKWLLKHGANPNADPYLLLFLMHQMRFDAIVALVNAGANPNPTVLMGDKPGPLLMLTQREYRSYFHHYLRSRIIRWYLKRAATKWHAEHRPSVTSTGSPIGDTKCSGV